MLEEEDADVDFISAGIKALDVKTDHGVSGEKATAAQSISEEKR